MSGAVDGDHTVIIDSHVHVASPDTERFPRRPTGVGSDWWRRDRSVETLLATLDSHGVSKAAIVQSVGVYGYDCDYAVAAVKAHDDRLALVGAVDMQLADPAAAMSSLHASAPLRGIRLFGVAGDLTWLVDGRADAVWQLADELDVTVVPTLYADRLDDLARLVAQHPTVPVAVEHCAFVDPGDAPAMESLVSLAALPSVNMKVTSHVLAAAEATGDPAAFVDRLADVFGANRLCWGSDHPQHEALAYPEMLALARRSVRHLGTDDQEQFFGETSARLWWPPRDASDR